jgi:hypothetical protein
MKKLTLTISLCFIGILAISAQKTTQDLGAFEELKVFDRINVTLIKSDKNQAVITGDDVNDVSVVNDDGRLKIRMEIDNAMDGNETFVTLYYANDLSLVDVNEGAEISNEGDLKANYLTLRAQEGGKLNVSVDTRNLDSKAVTGGKIQISGTATNQDVNVRTGGEYHSQVLKSDRTDVTVFAGGKAFVHAKEFVEANVTAGGTIEIFGNPETLQQDKTLGGSIIIRN